MGFNSTIKQKVGECNQCGKIAPLTKGQCTYCYWNGIRMKSVAKQQERGEVAEKIRESYINFAKRDNGELQRWFEERHKEMTGKCSHCNGMTTKGTKFYKASIAHLLPKRIFKSVATNPLNWIELCFWGNNCHGNMDNNMLDLIEMNCFDTIVERFLKIYPFIAKKERRHIPLVLLEYLKDETDLL